MSDDEKTSIAGIVELADDFIIIQPHKKRSKKSWLVPLSLFIVFAIFVWFYYEWKSPLIEIILESKLTVAENVVFGMPFFLDNETIAYSKNAESGGVVLNIKQLSPAGRQFSTKPISKTEYLQPCLSPSEDWIFLLTLLQYKTPRIYSVTQNGEIQPIAQGEWASFSSDGTKIAFQKEKDGKSEIWIMNFDGSDQNSTGLKGQHPEFSPRSNHLIYDSKNKKGVSIIQKVDVYDSPYIPKTLTSDKDSCMYPSFSPDGKIIIFYKKGDGLWAMKRGGSKQHRVLKSGISEMLIGRISPDGKIIAICSSKGKIDVYKIRYRKIKSKRSKIDIERLIEYIDSIKRSDN
ncbi:MAG: TolB family protein [Candidatus Poribacteria bacterium]